MHLIRANPDGLDCRFSVADNDDQKGGVPPSNPSEIAPISIEEEMRKSYLDYAMSVIVSRALPDVRDGLKPVHRRILFSMNENGYDWNKAYRKSARIVGDLTLSPDQQRAALTQLASAAESQITAALGPAAASRYLKYANSWLQDLRYGRAFAVTPDGLRTLPRTPRKP